MIYRMETEEFNYWKERCKLAEDILEVEPCDPDITSEQIAAWNAYLTFIKENGPKPYN